MSVIRTPKAIRYDLPIKELDKTITYRALRVGEQKAMLTAIGMKDAKALINIIVDIVSDCTFNEHDLTKIPMHIVDFIFLNIYIKSSGNMSQAEFNCAGTVEEEVTDDEGNTKTETVPCGARHVLNLDLNRTEIKYPENYDPTKVIEVGDGIVLKLRLPSFEAFRKMDVDKEWMDIADQFIFSGIECIQDGDDLKIPNIDFTLEDLVEWLNSLESGVMQQINDFFQEAPTLSLQVPVTCPKCGRKEDFELNSLEDFFA